MPPRLKKWLRRLGILVLVLAVLGVAAFTWVFYWPLEGKQEQGRGPGPGHADFLLKTTWKELRDTGFLQKNLREEPLVPDLKQTWRKDIQPALDRIASIEAQMNGRIPFGLSTLSVEQDIFPGEVIFAGRICRERGPPDTRPHGASSWSSSAPRGRGSCSRACSASSCATSWSRTARA